MKNKDDCIRVLAWPARRKKKDNPYSYLVQKHTAAYNVDTHEFNLRNLLRLNWDVIHIHWPNIFASRDNAIVQLLVAAGLISILFIQKTAGATKIVWTVHNLQAHEAKYPLIERVYMNTFTRMVDGLLSPSEYGREQIYLKYPRLSKLPCQITRIGHYRDLYTSPPDRKDARRQLSLDNTDAPLLLSFGQIRKYKNLGALVDIVNDADSEDLALVIAGSPADKEESEMLAQRNIQNKNITLHLRYIEEDAVPLYFSACDMVVLPFSSILNSSSALLALSLDRPVMVPDIGAMTELRDSIDAGWVSTYTGELTAEKIHKSLASAPKDGRPDLKEYEWPVIAAQTSDLFRVVKNGPSITFTTGRH